VIIRAIGPTLAGFGVPGVLGDPELTLFNSSGQPIFSNDDWRGAQAAEIIASGRAPQDERESAMIQTLQPGSYTAIVRGKAATTGVALVEVYDLDVTANSQMANISTRGKVLINDEVMIGGFILSGGGTSKLLVRATGPTLTQFAVPGALQDTTLDLFDGNGTRFASNDDWRSTQEQAIIATGRAPLDDREAAVLSTLAAGGYTAILRGKNGSVGVGLVEAYVVP
jgi:hypothetical protein